jgi:hypothetical protein
VTSHFVKSLDQHGAPERTKHAGATTSLLLTYLVLSTIGTLVVPGYATKCWARRWYSSIVGGITREARQGYGKVALGLLLLDSIGLTAVGLFAKDLEPSHWQVL